MRSKKGIKENYLHSIILISAESHGKRQTVSVMIEVDADLSLVKLFFTNSLCQKPLDYLRLNAAKIG